MHTLLNSRETLTFCNSRNRQAVYEGASITNGKSDLAIRLGHSSLKLSFVRDTEETTYQGKVAEESADEVLRSRRREAWQKWLHAHDEAEKPVLAGMPDLVSEEGTKIVDMNVEVN